MQDGHYFRVIECRSDSRVYTRRKAQEACSECRARLLFVGVQIDAIDHQ